jgi:hypothetical protein
VKKIVKNYPDSPTTSVKDYLTTFTDSKPNGTGECYTNVRGDMNFEAAWGVMGTGGSYATLSETLGVP